MLASKPKDSPTQEQHSFAELEEVQVDAHYGDFKQGPPHVDARFSFTKAASQNDEVKNLEEHIRTASKLKPFVPHPASTTAARRDPSEDQSSAGSSQLNEVSLIDKSNNFIRQGFGTAVSHQRAHEMFSNDDSQSLRS